jgi:transcriptional regulator with XRE-family HTH domain
MDIKMRLGKRLRSLREAADLTQDELAHAAKISRVFLGDVERGLKAATVETLDKIASALGVEPRELLAFEDDDQRPPGPGDRLGHEVALLAKGASPGEVDRFRRVARAFFRKR